VRGLVKKEKKEAIIKYAQIAQTLWLVLFPLLVLDIASKKRLTSYLNPKYVWLVYVGAALLIIIGIAVFILRFKNPQLEGHSEGSAFWTVFWTVLIFVPLILGQALGNQPLSTGRAARNEAVKSMVGTDTKSGNTGTVKADTSGWSYSDWFIAVSSDPEPSHFDGKKVNIDGAVFKPTEIEDGYFFLTRYKIWCCAADATAINIPVKYKGSSGLKDDQWVRVSGVMKDATWRGKRTLLLDADSVKEEKQPDDPYIY